LKEGDCLPLAEKAVSLLREHGLTVSVAESCTGGLVAHLLTEVPGSSEVFLLGAVTYANSAKVRVLKVAAEMIEREGAVSESVAQAMATGVQAVSGSAIAVATSGIAGPDGGTPEKPVGTVCFGYATPDGGSAETLRFTGSRSVVKLKSANQAIDWLRRYCEHESR
jgi:PncC family amidohydrolase